MADWQPSTADVAQHLRKFTIGRNGQHQDDFDDDVTPVRRSEVVKLTDGIVAEIGDVPEALGPQASAAATLGIASLAVIDLDRDLSRDLWERYESSLKRLRTDISAAGGKSHGSQAPTGRFPAPFGVSRDYF